MSNRKFTHCTDLEGNSTTKSFKTLSSQFGDGYVQDVSIGINNKSSAWQFSKTGSKALIVEIQHFFDDHKGADSFLWNHPLDGEVRVKTGDYTPVCLGGDVWRISTTFTQSFQP